MSSALISFLESKADFDEQQLAEVVSRFNSHKVKRKEVLVRAGDVAKYFYFVVDGCLRLYEIDSKGNDITTALKIIDRVVVEIVD